MRLSQNYGYHFGGPNNNDYSILGSVLGFPYLGTLPFSVQGLGFWVTTVAAVFGTILGPRYFIRPTSSTASGFNIDTAHPS